MPELSIPDSVGSLREIRLSGVTIDNDGLCNIINTKFPFLESLTLNITRCWVGILDIRSNSLQRLKIVLSHFRPTTEIVQVNAPKLLSFQYSGFTMPSLQFPTIVPEQIELTLWVNDPMEHLFFLNLRDALTLSSKFNIVIQSSKLAVLVPFDIDDVRTRVLFPATNVEKLSFESFSNDGLVENSVLLFDALFSICQPLYVEAHLQMRLKAADYFLKLIDLGVTENKSGNWPGLKRCEIRNGLVGEWETLTSSSLSLVGEWSQCDFDTHDDGFMTYIGGEAYAIDLDENMQLSDFKQEVAETIESTVDGMIIKYFLPGNKKNLITVSKDKDFQRMVNYYKEAPPGKNTKKKQPARR